MGLTNYKIYGIIYIVKELVRMEKSFVKVKMANGTYKMMTKAEFIKFFEKLRKIRRIQERNRIIEEMERED
jgi:ABC-type Na+ transport system ATPase subunit NatA